MGLWILSAFGRDDALRREIALPELTVERVRTIIGAPGDDAVIGECPLTREQFVALAPDDSPGPDDWDWFIGEVAVEEGEQRAGHFLPPR